MRWYPGKVCKSISFNGIIGYIQYSITQRHRRAKSVRISHCIAFVFTTAGGGNLTLKVAGFRHSLTLDILSSAAGRTAGILTCSVPTIAGSRQKGRPYKYDATLLEHVRIQNNTPIMLLHNEAYSKDREGFTALDALNEKARVRNKELYFEIPFNSVFANINRGRLVVPRYSSSIHRLTDGIQTLSNSASLQDCRLATSKHLATSKKVHDNVDRDSSSQCIHTLLRDHAHKRQSH
jgi:hypothetical protein